MDPLTDALANLSNFLYNPVTTKYLLDFVMGVIFLAGNVIIGRLNGNLRGLQYLYKAGGIRTGTANWLSFTIYLCLFAPHYAGNLNKLWYFMFLIIVSILIFSGCVAAAAKGSRWREHRILSGIAMNSGSLLLSVASFIIFIIFDYFLFV
jgi:hypothetical protein